MCTKNCECRMFLLVMKYSLNTDCINCRARVFRYRQEAFSLFFRSVSLSLALLKAPSMIRTANTPFDILCRELRRLDSDQDRLQMLTTLKSRLNNLQFTSQTLQCVVSIFHAEHYRLQAIQQLLSHVHDRSFALDDLSRSVKTNESIHSPLDHADPPQIEQPVAVNENCDPDRSPDITQALSNTSGVFEKAKQFVCRVFGSVASLDEASSSKRLITDVNTADDFPVTKRRHTDPSARDSPSDLSLTHCHSDIALTRQSSSSSRSLMVTQIHSILDNIDSVLDKIEAQASNTSRRSSSPHTSMDIDDGLVRPSTDQLTQTSIEIVEGRLTTIDGSGDTTPVFLIDHPSSTGSSTDEQNETFSTRSVL